MSELDALRAELARVNAERDNERERMLAEFALGAEELTAAEKKLRAAEQARSSAERQVVELRTDLERTRRELKQITASSLYPLFRFLQRAVRLARRVRARVIRATQR